MLGYVRPYARRAALAYACLLGVTALSLVVPWVIKQAVDLGLAQGAPSTLLVLGGGLLGLGLVRAGFSFGQRYLSAWLAHRVAYDLRNRLYDRIQTLSFAFHDHAQTGQLMSRCTSDISSVEALAGTGLAEFVNIAALFIAALVILFRIHPGLAAAALTPIPVLAFVTVRFGRRIGPLFQRIQEQHAEMTTILQEDLTGIQVVQAFTREPYEIQRFRDANVELMRRRLATIREWSFNFPMMTFIISLGTAIILWYGGHLVNDGRLTVGTLVAFNSYLGMLAVPVQRMGWLVDMAADAVASGRRIFEILDTPSPVQEKPGAIDLPVSAGRVEFRDVSFGYGDTPILEHISFVAEPGQIVALVGETGAGKSTLIHLIPRFYDVTAGQILVDGYDIRGVTLRSLRRQIGIVLQDTFLFSTTIRENIAYGREDATEDEIIAAAKAAHAHEFIVQFPDGYDTLVGERGITLSGGQRQRVAIARALLMDPRILLLDDSTSSVDTETERLIQDALARLMVGRTTFVIAQRLSTVMRVHQILVVDGGRIVERGTHAQLLALGGRYATIYEQQIRPMGERLAALPARARTRYGGETP
ncbi:MAG: ABC transporter ATP-binding protein [Anaerolineae bacterium]|nr:ABC transporter ATP-binding protein [Anaerolineae bacterium]